MSMITRVLLVWSLVVTAGLFLATGPVEVMTVDVMPFDVIRVGWGAVHGQDAIEGSGKPADALKQARLIRVPVPTTVEVESRLISTLESLTARQQGNDRPMAILEFVAADSLRDGDGSQPAIGQGTSFERALAIARFLSGPKGARIRTVAYIPESIRGHAVLIALGCEEIAMSPAAEIGQAGIDESPVEATVLQAYLDIASRRGVFPPAAVRSMLDPSEGLVRFQLEDGSFVYKTSAELQNALRPENVALESPLVPVHQMATFSGHELRSWRWITHTVPTREQLAPTLKLEMDAREKPTFDLPRKAMRTHLRGIIGHRQVNRVIRAIEDSITNDQSNLILIDLDSPGGNFEESLRLAFYLSSIPPDQAEVVVYVSGHARADASLIAMAADTISMREQAVLGGFGEASIAPADVESRKESLMKFASMTGRMNGDIAGCLCPDVAVHEYRSADGRRSRQVVGWQEEDGGKLPLWVQGPAENYTDGLSAEKAMALGIASDRSPSLESVGRSFGLNALPIEKQTNRVEQVVEWVASQRWLTFLLFMVGIICLSTELSTPGVGVPGAIALVCFLLFFWINMFQGTVEWLEILLIGGGVLCVAIEIFLLPGFGIFGVFGLGMLALGLVLAGQTFVIPTNAYQREQLIRGFGQLGFGVLVLFGTAIAFRKQLANLPMVRWFALQPPSQDSVVTQDEQMQEERLALLGRRATTMTRCNPYGKAIVLDRVVEVTSGSEWIDEGVEVELVDVHENHFVIKAIR
jgi:membrane-bound ClpP family serine protease